MKALSLRRRLTLWSALVTGVALVVFGVCAAFGVYFEQVEFIDHRLKADAELFFAELPPQGPASWENTDRAPLVLRGVGVLYGFAIGGADGKLDHTYPRNLEASFAAWPPKPGYFNRTIGARRFRLGVFKKEGRTLVLVASLHSADDLVTDLLPAYVLALPLVLIAVAVGSWWIAHRALQPIAEITAAAEAITAERLDARLPESPIEDEIGQHTRVINAMFDRLQRSFEQATRFTADASHELRTPLTILRGEIEQALARGMFSQDQENLLVDLLEQTGRLQKITDNLLLLARFDAGKAPLQREPVDFSTLVEEAGEDAELLGTPLKLSVTKEVTPAVFVVGDALLLRRLLLNLIDNAVRYNRSGGEVRLRLEVSGNDSILSISNTGKTIPHERRTELFQRFFRLSVDRNRDTGGSGLGLSLCREIAAAHQGRIELHRSEPDCTEFRLTLTLAENVKPPSVSTPATRAAGRVSVT